MMVPSQIFEFVIAYLPDMCQLEDCLVSKTISSYQVLKLPLTCHHSKSFWFQCLLGTWSFNFFFFFLIWLIWNLFSLSTILTKLLPRREGDMGIWILCAWMSYLLPPHLVGTSLPGSLSQQPGGPDPAVLYWPLCRVLLPGDRDAFQPAATEHLTLKVSSGLWIRKGLC